MRKYLELFKEGFPSDIDVKTSIENWPYVGYSVTQGVAFTVIPEPEQPSLYEAVDLGLPSGLKWATMNVGATSPEDAGLYFQWGDTVGYTKEQIEAGQKVFNWDTYFDTTDGGSTFIKYNNEGGLTVLEPEDDAATQNMGSGWRTPTLEEIRELDDNTTHTFIDLQGNEYSESRAQDGVISKGNLKGIKFTGSNGNSIFIPAAGCYEQNGLSSVGVYGELRSSSLHDSYSSHAESLYCDRDGYLMFGLNNRYVGQFVRGVKA